VSTLPYCARDVVTLPPRDALLYRGLLSFFERTGLWRYPPARTGDVEEMRLLDRVYWLYKAGRPIERAVRGSRLEERFAQQDAFDWTPPADFAVTGELRLAAAGDLMSHPYLARSGDSLYGELADVLFGADVSMANLECVVLDRALGLTIDTTAKTGPPLVLARDAFEVAAGSWSFLATACNHSLDFGEQGVASTIAALRERRIEFHGLNEREDDADRATIVEKRGIRLGIVSHTFGLNGRQPPPHRPRIVNRMRLNGPADRLDLGPLEAQLRHCEEAGVDFVIAQLHWGMEFELYPRPEQLDVAHRLAELGVDVILGHHPHVVQPVEHYRTERDPLRVVPIYYSLGNLINPFSAPFMGRSHVAALELVKGSCPGGASRTYVRRASVIEVDQHADPASQRLVLRRA
jgi:poly-gamma-glutamate synthesis protein (capsule biosynthesis protein)